MLKKWIKIPSEYNQKIKDLKIRELLSIKISDQDICVVIVDNELFALGTCNLKGVISCPKHGYKFDCKTGKDLDNNGYHLKRQKIEKRAEDYWLFI